MDLLDPAEMDIATLTEALALSLPGDTALLQAGHESGDQSKEGISPRPIAAVLRGSDDEGPVLLVRICITDVGYLHELRDTVLSSCPRALLTM